ncbi:NAD(P)H-hydrate dehydratase [Legionella dresdenensis]|uniref:Bifunctional NAD(P)H-hydrate repair enzyme n=1 Tax=Legionella dresdenensis TaxID=450200 RepID=A0ABV8CEY0_9GAMM
MTLTVPVCTTSQIRSLERYAISQIGMSEQELMYEAGLAAFNNLKQLYPSAQKITVFCGGGNNAGDGYVLARLAFKAGYDVTINYYKPLEALPEAASTEAQAAISAGIPCVPIEQWEDIDADVIIDALLGIGLTGNVRDPLAAAINLINSSNTPVIALDIPSGLNADTGQVMGTCVIADVTSTFVAYKAGLVTLDGPDYCGQIICNDLGIDLQTARNFQPIATLIDDQIAEKNLQPRKRNCHKGDFGHVLIIGGGPGMPGAVCLAANAALRTGAGLVSIATIEAHANHIVPGLPEAIIHGLTDASQILPLLEKATVCVLGPGLGIDQWAIDLFSQVISCQLPMVIDASALRLLAGMPQHDDNWVLTPHPGEAASLLSCATQDIQSDRYAAAAEIQHRYGGNVVLKGAGTLIACDDDSLHVCTIGNPGMASAGMGDVLSGVIAGLIAQGMQLNQAAKLGVWLHARAGDLASHKGGERGLIASDLMPYLRTLVNP